MHTWEQISFRGSPQGKGNTCQLWRSGPAQRGLETPKKYISHNMGQVEVSGALDRSKKISPMVPGGFGKDVDLKKREKLNTKT